MPDDICPACKTNLNHSHTIDDPVWLNDPIKTPYGLSGEDHVGSSPILIGHIQQLQIYYNNVMIGAGITPPTWLNSKDANRNHIIQLRVCVELLLTNLGLTLTDYFRGDKYGNTYSGDVQEDWTDCERIDGRPELPLGTPIKAIHIEELRRGMLSGFMYYFIIPSLSSDYYNELYGEHRIPSDSPYQTAIAINSRVFPSETYGYSGSQWGGCVYSSYDPIGQIYYRGTTSLILAMKSLYAVGALGSYNLWTTDGSYDDANSNVHSVCMGMDKTLVGGESDYRLFAVICKYHELTWPDGYPGRSNILTFKNIPYSVYEFKSPKTRVVGISTGEPSQEFDITTISGIRWSNISLFFQIDYNYDEYDFNKGFFKVYVGGVEWTRVFDLSIYDENALVYKVDASGKIQFGIEDLEGDPESRHGAIPPVGAQITMWLGMWAANYNRWEEVRKVWSNDGASNLLFPLNLSNKKLVMEKAKLKDEGYSTALTSTVDVAVGPLSEEYRYGGTFWKTQDSTGVSNLVYSNIAYTQLLGDHISPQMASNFHRLTTWGDTGHILSPWTGAFNITGYGLVVRIDNIIGMNWHDGHYEYTVYQISLDESWSFACINNTDSTISCDGHSTPFSTPASYSSIPNPMGFAEWSAETWYLDSGLYRKRWIQQKHVYWPTTFADIKDSELAAAYATKQGPSQIVVQVVNKAITENTAGIKLLNQWMAFWNKNIQRSFTLTLQS